LYSYTNGNPVNFIDPLGLTQREIDIACDLEKETQKDMKLSDQFDCRDLGYYKPNTERRGQVLQNQT
jgi:hypothetical protein